MGRTGEVTRTTGETSVEVGLNLDGGGIVAVETGVGFFDHMLEAFGRHALIDLNVKATGDLEVDAHHTVEDVGICIGEALTQAIGDKTGVTRFGSIAVPMDEALVLAAVDISGRGGLVYEVDVPIEFVGNFDTTLAREFMTALAMNAGLTLHVHSISGDNSHHIIEAAFKAVARALKQAVAIDPRCEDVPSTKGTL
jgi:imidazoleglycerol-phosphate dehydratase